LKEISSEVALEMFSGEERAAAVAHLEVCASCRREVAQLTETVEELLTLAPSVEPPAGFEQRVLQRIEALAPTDEAATVRRFPTWSRRAPRRLVAAAAAVILLVGAVALVLTRWGSDDARTQVAAMQASSGQVVGDVSLTHDPAKAVLTIPDWVGLVRGYGGTVDAPYWVAIQTSDGSRELARLPSPDQQPWTIALDHDPSTVVSVSVVDNSGTVWCTAQFEGT
jgi:hypothetical protein